MLRSFRRRSRVWNLLPIAVALLTTSLANGQDCRDDTYTSAIRLMRILYPELSGRGVFMDVQAQYPFEADGPLLSFYISVSASDQMGRIVAAPLPNPSSAEKVGHLSAHFQFDGRDQRILHLVASGALLNSEKEQALTKLVDDHPDWSETRMTDALSSAGAKFGPGQRDAILARFPFKDLESMLGKIEDKSAEFTFRGNREAPYYAVMEWTVRFQTIRNGRKTEYTASLEPFDGRVVSLGRRALD